MTYTLGVLTDEISDDLQEAIDLAKSWGIGEIELHSVWGTNICDLSDTDLSRALRIVRKSRVKVTCIDSLTLRCDLDNDEEYAAHIAHLKRSMEIAPLFDTNIVRLFSFWKLPNPDEAAWERIWTKLELPIRIAETEGIVLGFENVSSGNIGTSADLERLFAQFDSPALKLIWDPGNAAAAGDSRSALEGYERVKDRVVHIHVKDVAFVNGQRQWLPIGQGIVDYVPFLKALECDNYTGTVALETHYRAPGGTGAEATAASLLGLREAIRRAESGDLLNSRNGKG